MQRIGFTNGCYDLFHRGHIFFLSKCYNYCDYLIVAVNSDESVRHLKGEGRPVNSLHKRLLDLNNYASAVIPFDGNVSKLVSIINPDIVILGYDQYWAEAAPHRTFTTIGKLEGFSTTLQIKAQQDKTAI